MWFHPLHSSPHHTNRGASEYLNKRSPLLWNTPSSGAHVSLLIFTNIYYISCSFYSHPPSSLNQFAAMSPERYHWSLCPGNQTQTPRFEPDHMPKRDQQDWKLGQGLGFNEPSYQCQIAYWVGFRPNLQLVPSSRPEVRFKISSKG
jgi:hypothetical protein